MADRGKSDILAFMSGETEDRMTVEEYLAWSVVVVEVIPPTSGGSSGRGSNCRSRSFTHRKKRARKAAGQARAFGLR
ncbi:hypothetical protein WOC76_11715 [Methylocystis sp. IM3]|uniref:hypothetical protein n=1 Tax=unclassified Methylocystis TaxID=2625913 RepID=UPI0030FB4F92